jgi:hypothetical protein
VEPRATGLENKAGTGRDDEGTKDVGYGVYERTGVPLGVGHGQVDRVRGIGGVRAGGCWAGRVEGCGQGGEGRR